MSRKPEPQVVQDRLMECGYTFEEAMRMVAAAAAPRLLMLQVQETDQQAFSLGPEGAARLAATRVRNTARMFADELMNLGLIVHSQERDDMRLLTNHRFSLRLA